MTQKFKVWKYLVDKQNVRNENILNTPYINFIVILVKPLFLQTWLFLLSFIKYKYIPDRVLILLCFSGI